MTGPIPTSSMAALNIHDSVVPRGLGVAQQREIAATQAQNAALDRPYRPQSRSFPSSASLYVGELDPSVQESTLFDIFNTIGPVDSVRVCRDSITNRSLGYAFVNFKTHIDGERALQALNSTLIHGKPCRVMWSQRDLAKRKISGGNIFVKNLDPSITSKSLRDTFAHYGSILSCKVVTDIQGQSKGYGFVHYDTIEAAENAIQHVNGTTVYDKELYVGHHIPKRERQQHQQQQNHHNHHHPHPHHNSNNNSHYHHNNTNHSNGHNHGNATNNHSNGNHHHHHPPQQQTKFTNVYVKNLMPDIKEEELKELFGGFGPIVSVLIQRDENGNSKGFGFVNFENHEDAERAVQQMNETEYIGRRLYVSRAQKKSEREENKHHHHHQTSPQHNNSNSLSQPPPQQHSHSQSNNNHTNNNNSNTAFNHHHQHHHQQPQQHQNHHHPSSQPPHDSNNNSNNSNNSSTPSNNNTITTSTNNHGAPSTTVTTKNNRYQGMNLYIKNLDEELNDQRLRDEFTKYGTITSAKVMRDENTGQSKGFGFVCFSNAQEAAKAVTKMNGQRILSKSIFVALAQRKEDRSNSNNSNNNRHHVDHIAQRNNQLHLQQPFMPMPGYIPGAPMYYEYSNFPPQPDGRPPRYQGPYIKQGYHAPVHAAYYMTPPHPYPRPPTMYPTTASTNNTTASTTAPSTPTTATSVPTGNAVVTTNTNPTTAVNTTITTNGGNVTTTVEEENPKEEELQLLSMDMLSSYSDETQNQILGERIYAVVQAKYPQLAGKVTGMLLEMDKEDLISLINDRESLESKADEAVNVLEQHRASQTTEE
ncbi:hypothetical protein BDC45DRAFT_513787 [Circinella umbellata]|nr:hypothetical protein BDC45DRAFT_513787 [Circinella umbellata]